MSLRSSSAPGKICAYCGEPVLTGEQGPEHPIQAALGSSWEVYTVCDPCNEYANREIDQWFLDDDLILELRSRHDVRDPRHSGRTRRVPSPLLRGYTPEGLYVVADDDGHPHVRGAQIETGDDGEVYITAGSHEEMERIIEKLRIKAAVDGKTVTVGEPISVEDRPRITGRLKVRPWVLRRAVSKIALAAGSVAYAESWRDSDDARRLRTWMRDKDALPFDHCPFEQVEGSLLEELVDPSHHAVFFLRTEEVTLLVVVLFGEIAFKVPIDTAGLPVPRNAWYLDPRRPRKRGETDWSALTTNVLRHRFPEEFEDEAA